LKRYLITFLFLSPFYNLQAQALEVGGGIDLNFLRGDLNPNFNPFLARPGGNVIVRYNFSRAFSLRANTSYGWLTGSDKLSSNPANKYRDRKFTAKLQDWGADLEFNFLNFRSSGTIIKSSWTPTLSAGLGQFRIPQISYISNGVKNSTDYDAPRFSFNYGFGVKKQLTGNLNFTGTFRVSSPILTDGQDAYDGMGFKKDGTTSNSYVLNPIDDPKVTTPNTHTKDMFYHASFTISYVFSTVRCPNPKR
jgi:hypothetical protein